jgi:hypothetical protein
LGGCERRARGAVVRREMARGQEARERRIEGKGIEDARGCENARTPWNRETDASTGMVGSDHQDATTSYTHRSFWVTNGAKGGSDLAHGGNRCRGALDDDAEARRIGEAVHTYTTSRPVLGSWFLE